LKGRGYTECLLQGLCDEGPLVRIAEEGKGASDLPPRRLTMVGIRGEYWPASRCVPHDKDVRNLSRSASVDAFVVRVVVERSLDNDVCTFQAELFRDLA